MVRALQIPLFWHHRFYERVLGRGESKHRLTALIFRSTAGASFFPLPPDTLLIALTTAAHKKWVRFALICSVGSVIGGMLGFLMGYATLAATGQTIIALVASISGNNPDRMLEVARYWFNEKRIRGLLVGLRAAGIAGFTPIPYKVPTIAASSFEMSFPNSFSPRLSAALCGFSPSAGQPACCSRSMESELRNPSKHTLPRRPLTGLDVVMEGIAYCD
jgi:membrane protein YqaA with SNARE-associated domain